ncbi:MAG TPA: hypothetical protein VFF79_20160 [Conexibacter sp.]|jgi:hypothetical protein|nr:hypothetical protein [Conexibacter sp.]
MRNLLTTRTAKSARTKRSLTLLGALILLVVAGYAVAANAGPSVATPKITSGPSGVTNVTSATLTFTVGARGDTLECSLDGAPYAACTSPKTYSGLADGAHTFRVRDRNPRLGAGDPATRTWTVDTVPPAAPQITQEPPTITNVDHATFAYTDAEAGVSWECRVDGRDWTACTDPVTWWGLHDGVRTFMVRARDAAGNRGPATSYTWTIDTVAPPKPQLTQRPPNPSASSSATFAFTDREAGVTFVCSLDGAAYASCASPQTYNGLSNGTHRFDVRALDAAGNRSGVTEATWRVAASTTGLPFTISGGYGGLLYPGKTGTLALRISNPNGSAIVVTSLTVTVQPGSSNAGCDGPANLGVAQSNVSAANPLTVPANGSVTLPSGGVSAPSVTMLNLPTNQDACKGAVYTFAYSGSSHS